MKRVLASFPEKVSEKLVIRDGTVSIDDYGCSYLYSNISSVTLPDSLERIGAHDFVCSYFDKIDLPEGLEFIGDGNINILDMILLKNYIISGGSAEQKILADTNLDGIVSVQDLVTLRKVLLGIDECSKGLRDIRIDQISIDTIAPETYVCIDSKEEIETFVRVFDLKDCDKYDEIVSAVTQYLKDGFVVYAAGAVKYGDIPNIMTINPSKDTTISAFYAEYHIS